MIRAPLLFEQLALILARPACSGHDSIEGRALGAFLDVEPFADALAAVDDVLEEDAPFHIHFSDIAFANRNETKHLPYGEGTLRVEPLRDALTRFDRPATVISESPDEASSQAIREVLLGLREDVSAAAPA